jgi:hypothetical protein
MPFQPASFAVMRHMRASAGLRQSSLKVRYSIRHEDAGVSARRGRMPETCRMIGLVSWWMMSISAMIFLRPGHSAKTALFSLAAASMGWAAGEIGREFGKCLSGRWPWQK